MRAMIPGARGARQPVPGPRAPAVPGGNKMADANPVNAGMQREADPQQAEGHRSAWILTGYGIFALVVISLIAYGAAQYAVR